MQGGAGRQPGDDGGRDCSDVSTGQGQVKVASNHQELKEVKKDPPLDPSEGAGKAWWTH